MISAELEDALCCILASISIECPGIFEETNINSSLVLMYEREEDNVFTENDAVMIGHIAPPEVGTFFGSWGIWDADADMIEDCGFSFCSREDRLRVIEAVKNISSEEEVIIDGFYDRNLTKINEMVKLIKL